MDYPTVNIIIPKTYKELYDYKLFGNAEIIIVDIGKERSAQRNYGASLAKGKYLLFLDCDMVIHPMLIPECVALCELYGYGALYIPEVIIGNKFRNFERSFYDGTVIDAVRFIKKDIFQTVGGFDEKLTGPEDWDIDRRIAEITMRGICKYPIYHHEEDFNLKDYLKGKKYYQRGIKEYSIKWHKDFIIKKQIGFWYRYIGVFTENKKWQKLLCHPFLMLGMYFLRFTVGLSFLLH